MTYQELLKKVQTALAKADASNINEHIAIQVNVTGDAAGAFYMEVKEDVGVLYVEGYDYRDRDALLTADGAEVLAFAQGKLPLEQAVAEGKIAHEGDWEKALKVAAIIPVKKAAAKKAEAPAEAPAAEAPAVEAPAEAKPKRTTKKAAAKKTEAPAAEAKPKRTTKKAAAKKTEAPAAEAKTEEKPKRGRKKKAE